MIRLALLLFVLLLFVSTREGMFVSTREGMEEDYLSLAIKSIESATKDNRMTSAQQIALEDALTYAQYIKNIGSI